MANPTANINVRSSLQITPITGQEAPQYRSYPTSFNAVMYGSAGPTPGSIRATNTGTVVNLSELTAMGGMCRIINNDLVNTLTWGVYVPGLSVFVPVGDVLPGEVYVLRLSQYLQSEEPGTGSGTYGFSELMVRSPKGTTILVTIEAFDP